MVLDSIDAERTVVDSTLVGSARFSGRVELSGRTLPHFDEDLRSQSVCFEADSVSAARLPRWAHDERRPWFCFENRADAERLLGAPGTSVDAILVIDRLTIQRNLTDAVNSARLATVVRVDNADITFDPVPCDGLESSILAAPPSRAGLRAAGGAPAQVEAATEPNRHVPGAIDSLFTVRYRDLVADLRTPSGGRDMAERVVVTGSRWVRHDGLGIGAPAAQVTAILGEPTARRPDALVYDCGMHTEQPVTFQLAGNVVERIEIDYYVD
jgi:hypothetical protein